MSFRPQVIVYHYPCTDGATAAALLADFYDMDSSITWVRGTYSNPNLLDDIATVSRGKAVLFVDFSLKADAMSHLLTVAQTVVVLDHHDSALREFAKLGDYVIRDPVAAPDFNVNATYAPGLHAFMRMDMSGAGLAFRWLYGWDEELPEAVALTQRIDLGQEPDNRTRQFKWYTRALPMDVERLHALRYGHVVQSETVTESTFVQGDAIKRFVDLCVEQYVDAAKVVEYEVGGTTYTIPTGFASYAFASDVANRLIYQRDGGRYDMAVCVYFDAHGMGLSFRSKNGVECNVVAEALGGGGHKQAAGANIAWTDIIEFVQGIITNLIVQENTNDS